MVREVYLFIYLYYQVLDSRSMMTTERRRLNGKTEQARKEKGHSRQNVFV